MDIKKIATKTLRMHKCMNFSLTIFLVPHHANGAASVNYKHLRLRSG